MPTVLQLGKDLNGFCTYRMDFSDTGYQTALSAGTAQNILVPENVNEAWFSYSAGSNVFVNPNGTASLPGGSFTQTYQDLNPVARRVSPGQQLSFVSSQTAYVNVSFYRNPNP